MVLFDYKSINVIKLNYIGNLMKKSQIFEQNRVVAVNSNHSILIIMQADR